MGGGFKDFEKLLNGGGGQNKQGGGSEKTKIGLSLYTLTI